MAKFYTPSKLSENIRETPEGFLFCLSVPIARTGWQTYGEGETPLEVGEDGTIKIYRDPKEVFRPQTIASFQGKAITIKHPENFVVPDNWSYLAKGTIQNVRKSDEKDEDGEESLLADLLVTERMAIQLIKNGLREVSCGYEAEYEQTGEGEGKQTNIIGNHLALVEEGRAGSSYAINDHKGKVTMSNKVAEKLKKLLGKTVDDAMEEKEEKKAMDQSAYDELVEKVSDLMQRVEGLLEVKKSKDDAKAKDEEEKPAEKKEEKAKDDEAGSQIEERLKAVEAAVAKLLQMESKEAEDEEEESEDDDFEESSMTGDTASRAEILSPGIKAVKGTDIKVKALEDAYKTKEGMDVIHAFTGGKKPVFDSAEKISHLFIAASEVLKANRGNGLEKTKDGKVFDQGDNKAEPMTAEKMNEINAAHWARK